MNFQADIALKIQDGDKKAFEEVFRALYAALCSYANNYLKDHDQAEEVVQEVFCNYWNKRKSLEITGTLDAYIFQSVRNACFNYIKHQKVRRDYALDQLSSLRHEETQQHDVLIALELEQKIEECLLQLPPERQKIFRMSREEGLKYKEIAEKMNISIKTVEAQMGKALHSMREKLLAYLSLALLIGWDIIHWLNNNL